MRFPSSTYRLQLRAEFGFEDAAAIVPYLAALGIGDVYASPILASTSGSPHGYDGIDPTRIDEPRGGAAGFKALVGAAQQQGLGMLVDIVPNHLATSEQNRWWWDVLRRGRESAHARAFDIDWEAPGLDGKLLLPVLGKPVAEVVRDGELTIDLEDPRGPVLRYFDRALPLASYTEMLDLPLDELLELQHYRLADWRDGPELINYRRFFDITDLVSLHQEDPEVFAATHPAILSLIEDGSITGLRIDHVDGLADPAGYLERLEAATRGIYVVVEKILAADEELPETWPVAGTTGYEVLDAIGSVFVDAEGANELEALQARVAGIDAPFHEIALAAKREVMASSFPGDVRAVARKLDDAGRGRRGGDRCHHRPARGVPDVRRQRRPLRRRRSSAGRTRPRGSARLGAGRGPRPRRPRAARGSLSRGPPLAAAVRAGGGKGCRGHGDLPLPRARLAERGRGRPRRGAADDRCAAPPARDPRAHLARVADTALHPRYEAQRGHPRAHRRALLALGELRGGRDATRRAP